MMCVLEKTIYSAFLHKIDYVYGRSIYAMDTKIHIRNTLTDVEIVDFLLKQHNIVVKTINLTTLNLIIIFWEDNNLRTLKLSNFAKLFFTEEASRSYNINNIIK